ncbi:MAG: hypothetical protein IPG21_14945 [Saprospiraceae bacterium]|nr:hypothetical protein [Candidatus Vicinibacter affinis]
MPESKKEMQGMELALELPLELYLGSCMALSMETFLKALQLVLPWVQQSGPFLTIQERKNNTKKCIDYKQ